MARLSDPEKTIWEWKARAEAAERALALQHEAADQAQEYIAMLEEALRDVLRNHGHGTECGCMWCATLEKADAS